MLKIILPPKVPCWKCSVGLYRCENLDGDVMACDCEDGYRYDFDALAAAVREAGLFYELKDPYPNKDADQCQVEIVTEPRFRGWCRVKIEGPTPTAALLNAINEFNKEEEVDG